MVINLNVSILFSQQYLGFYFLIFLFFQQLMTFTSIKIPYLKLQIHKMFPPISTLSDKFPEQPVNDKNLFDLF
jgi:hypothetical protein